MKKIIIANWKCNPTTAKEAKEILSSIKPFLSKNSARVFFCPPFVYLPLIADFLKSFSDCQLGAQDCFWEDKGAFTGEISPLMLKNLKVKLVILGHSERKRIFQENDEQIKKKLILVLKNNLIPLLCLGDSQEERKTGKMFEVIEKKLRFVLSKTSKKDLSKILIAYEPEWAIGSGNPCHVEEAETMAIFIKKTISSMFGKASGQKIQILYGGSVDSQSIKLFLQSEWINGLLVGGNSLDKKEFLSILKNI